MNCRTPNRDSIYTTTTLLDKTFVALACLYSYIFKICRDDFSILLLEPPGPLNTCLGAFLGDVGVETSC